MRMTFHRRRKRERNKGTDVGEANQPQMHAGGGSKRWFAGDDDEEQSITVSQGDRDHWLCSVTSTCLPGPRRSIASPLALLSTPRILTS